MYAIVLLVAIFIPSLAQAATRYVDGNLASTCSGSVYSIASRNCSGSDGTGYKTVPEGLRALAVGDTLYIRAGTYSITSTYGNAAADKYGGTGTSWATATKIMNYPGEAVTVQNKGFNLDNSVSTGGIAYLIWEGDSRSNFIFELQGAGGDQMGFRFANAVHHVRLKKLTVRNFTQHGIGSGGCTGTKPDSIEIIDTQVSANGNNSSGAQHEHGIYPACSSNWLVEYNYVYNNFSSGIHFYASSTNYHTNATIRYNVVEGRQSGSTGGAAIVVATGSGHQVYRNLLIGQGGAGGKLNVGVVLYGPQSGTTIYHNTVYDMVNYGVQVGDSGVSSTIIKNNIFNTTIADPIYDVGTSTTKANNHCQVADTGCSLTGSAGFVSAGTNFALASTSNAIDAGVAITGFSYNGSAPDIGAFETITFATCVVENGDASNLRITFNNNVSPPLLPASPAFGANKFTARKAGANDVVTAATRVGDNRIDLTLTDAIVNGNAVDFSYSITSGDVTDSALLGNVSGTTNQRLNAITNQSCTNNVGAAASHLFIQAKFQFHDLRGTEAAPVVKPFATAAEDTNTPIVPGGKVRLRLALSCTTADCPPTGFYLYYDKDAAGSYAVVPDSFSTDNIAFCGTGADPDIPLSASATTDQLSTAGTFVAGALVRTSNAIPTVDIAQNGKSEMEYCLALDTDATAGTTYDFRIRKQDGTVIDTYTVTPRLTVVATSTGMGF